MKKISIIIMSLILIICTFCFFACDKDEKGHEHTFSEWQTDKDYHYKQCTQDGCNHIEFKGSHSFVNDVCIICGCAQEVETVATPDNISNVLQNAKDGTEITLTAGRYTTSVSISNKKNLTITGGNGVILEDNIRISSGCENLIIKNVTFAKPVPQKYSSDLEAGGIRILGDINGLTLKDCDFTHFSQIIVINPSSLENGVKDLVIDGCKFYELSNKNNSLSPIYMGCKIENATINNCLFEDIEYNAVQFSGAVKGNVNITNSTFKDIGSRFFNIINASGVNWNISQNKFYETAYSKHGGYFKGEKQHGTTFTIGINYWESIPELDVSFFALEDGNIITTDGITYNPEEQLEIVD